ncbi:MerR family transcriptional regulator [Marisediminicola senii]|uniref:MerR family transcriptional regulator n=1 Tax=Marisediminicola senii TaxID=2711233 RepID=UPI001F2B6BA1|nr:MerR family transcriptional regulator [Marisediminicola senii]
MHIGELAEKSSMSLRTIRHYDDVGLLKPSGRSDGGFRLYTEADLQRLLLIRRMRPLGFTIEEMGELLLVISTLQADEPESARSVSREKLNGFVEQAEVRREKLQDYLVRSDELLQLLRALRE